MHRELLIPRILSFSSQLNKRKRKIRLFMMIGLNHGINTARDPLAMRRWEHKWHRSDTFSRPKIPPPLHKRFEFKKIGCFGGNNGSGRQSRRGARVSVLNPSSPEIQARWSFLRRWKHRARAPRQAGSYNLMQALLFLNYCLLDCFALLIFMIFWRIELL